MKYLSILLTLFSEPSVFFRLVRLSIMACIMSLLYAQTLDALSGFQFAMHSASVGVFTILVFWSTEQNHESTPITGFSD